MAQSPYIHPLLDLSDHRGVLNIAQYLQSFFLHLTPVNCEILFGTSTIDLMLSWRKVNKFIVLFLRYTHSPQLYSTCQIDPSLVEALHHPIARVEAVRVKYVITGV
jgi:hypothetical protein